MAIVRRKDGPGLSLMDGGRRKEGLIIIGQGTSLHM